MLTILMVIALISISLIPISAKSESENNYEIERNIYISDIKLIRDTKLLVPSGFNEFQNDVVEFTYFSQEDIQVYRALRINQYITIYNSANTVVATGRTYNENIPADNPNFMTRGAWSAFFNYAYGYTQIDDITSKTIGQIVGLLVSACTGPAYFIANEAAAMCVEVATTIYNELVDQVWITQKMSQYSTCNILAKLKFSYYMDDKRTRYMGDSGEQVSWISTPWDYTQPADCRVLVNDYPY